METSSTLKIGDPAPDFTLQAANRSQLFSLAELRQRGPVVVDFQRGTW